MTRSATLRTGKYAAKVTGRVLATQKKNFRATVGNQVRIEQKVKQIITANTVMPGLNHHYITFGKKVAKLVEKYSGDTLLVEVCIEFVKWSSRGLDQGILNRIIESMSATGCSIPFSYDFSTGAGADKWAYRCCHASMPPAAKQVCFAEYNAGEYTAISLDDANRVGQSCVAVIPAPGDYGTQQYRFAIAEDPARMTSLTIMSVAWPSVTPGNVYIWNYTTTSWNLVGTHGLPAKTTVEMTYNAGFTDYIQGGELWLSVQGDKALQGGVLWFSNIWMYYVRVSGETRP